MTPKKLTTYKTKLVGIRSELVGDVGKNLKSSKQEMNGQVPDVSDDAAQSYSKQLPPLQLSPFVSQDLAPKARKIGISGF